MTLQEAFDLFMYEQRFRNNADATIEYYQLSLGLFLDFVGADQSVDVLDISVYKDYVISLQTGGHLKSTSINTYVRAVKAFYNWLIDDDRIGDCSRKLKLIKQKREKIIPLSDDELQRLLNCFDCSDLLQLRNKCLTLLMVDCGLRRAETTRLRCSDVDFARNCVLVSGKGAKERLVPLGDNAAALLKVYDERIAFRRQKKVDAFFLDRFGQPLDVNAVDLIFSKLKDTTGIQRLRCHLLRHTFATNYLLDGGDIETLRLILGHSSIVITQLYLHLAADQRLLSDRRSTHLDNLRLEKP